MAKPDYQLPLGGKSIELAGGRLRELPLGGKFVLRCDVTDAAVNRALQASGLQLPQQANTTWQSPHAQVLWMGPDEWLIRGDSDPESADWQRIWADLEKALSNTHFAMVDVSDYYSLFELTSPHAYEVIARSCPLDLQQAFAANGSAERSSCAQTRIGNAAVLINPIGSADSLSDKVSSQNKVTGCVLQVRWSYADYLWKLLARSAISFQD